MSVTSWLLRPREGAVVWATQRLEEIAGFADAVTLLDEGDVRFLGTVPELMALAAPRRFVLQLRGAGGNQALPDLGQLLSGWHTWSLPICRRPSTSCSCWRTTSYSATLSESSRRRVSRCSRAARSARTWKRPFFA